MAVETFSASAPGKVILFGEHAVVHGASCIAASIDLRTSATVYLCDDCSEGSLAGETNSSLIMNQIILTLPGLDLEWHWQLEELGPLLRALNGPSPVCVKETTEELTTTLRAVAKSKISSDASESLVGGAAAFLFLHISILGLQASRTLISSELPMGAGLGSSAAFSASLVGAMLAAVRAPGFTKASSGKAASTQLDTDTSSEGSQGEPTWGHRARDSAMSDGASPSDSCRNDFDDRLPPNGSQMREVEQRVGELPPREACSVVSPAEALKRSGQRGNPNGLSGAAVDVAARHAVDVANCLKDRQGGVLRQEDSLKPYNLEGVELANAWAFQAERIIHGRPSGVDNTVSCFGGAICFRKGDITRLPHVLSLRMLLTNTNVGRDTKALVAGVGQRAARLKAVYEPLFTSIDEISQAFLRVSLDGLTEHGSLQGLVEELVDLNQAVLRGIGVSHRKIEEIIATTADLGLHSKLTGAGGGGCVLTLLRDLEDRQFSELIARLQSKGFSCFQVTVGGPGLQWMTS